jgi:phosphoenolpyruvate-protein kinase (PTS system EI component)
MAERRLRGEPASPGDAVGRLWRLPDAAADDGATVPESERAAEQTAALRGLAAAGAQLEELAATLPGPEAAILEANVLMASDPLLVAAVERRVLEEGLPAPSAIVAAAEEQAALLAAIDDAHLAARADDLRSLGRRAAAAARGDEGAELRVPDGAIVVATDLGPGDVSEIAGHAVGIVLAEGGPTTHAAIVARSLGIPAICGVGPALTEAPEGVTLVLDGGHGEVTVDPDERIVAVVGARLAARRAARERDRVERDRPTETLDGHPVTVLANVSSETEVAVALDYGAAGVGLLRTELAFLDAEHWPTVAEHEAALRPVLAALAGKPAVVRVLDLGGDKAPPFLAPGPERGLRLLAGYRAEFESQLEALLRLSQEFRLRILLPLVEDLGQLLWAREAIEMVATRVGVAELPEIGAMVETPGAAAAAAELAAHSTFLSIGTNDLSAAIFERDRFTEGVPPAHHPRVLAAIRQTVAGAHAAGVPLEVCGEAASSRVVMPLLVGFGVDELSVGAAAVGEVRRWVRRLDRAAAGELADRALAAGSEAEVAALVESAAPLYSADTATIHVRR